MTRNRASAKAAGTAHETAIVNYLQPLLPNGDYIERRRLNGANDTGDIGGIRTLQGQRVVVEAKNYGGRVQVGPWLKEARTEALNDKAPVGVVVAKRLGTTDPGSQIVMMELRDLAVLLGADPSEV